MKTANLSVRSFLNSNLQIKAGALTYQTMLAIVPALALMFAICRGFGFSNLLQTQLFSYFPAQQEALGTAFQFVDSYLAQSSEGIFVGIGVVFLLWTLISLISNVEQAFNSIWGIPRGRSFWRKITDYTAILLILPILMICSSGINVLMSTTLQQIFSWDILSPLVSYLLDFSSLLLVWLFFTGSYMLVPNTKVKFKNAFVAGIIAGTGFMILQWLFVSGQIYVTKYNAIYGSFAFLPLLLIWMQLVWLITLSGAVYCYSSQNIFEFSFSNQTEQISEGYRWRITVAVMTIAVNRFLKEKQPLNDHQISETYGLPISLVTGAINVLTETGLLMYVVNKPGESFAVAPAIDPTTLTLGELLRRLANKGSKGFIPQFDQRFSSVNEALDSLGSISVEQADKVLLSSLDIKEVPATH
jgi:membrane protein